MKKIILGLCVLALFIQCKQENSGDTERSNAEKAAVKSSVEYEPTNGQVYPLNSKPSVDNFEEQVAYQRAFDATLWYQSANSYKQFRKGFFEMPGIDNNVVATYSDRINQKSEVITGNTVTNYIVAFSDLKDGPVILEIPAKNDKASLYGQVLDAWQFTIADVGPVGVDKGMGGKYLFIPPDYEGQIPANVFPVYSNTYQIGLVFRSVKGPKGNETDAFEYTKLINMYPLSQIDNKPAPRNIDPMAKGLPVSTLPLYDIGLVESLHEFINYEPINEYDKVMLGMLASIGIEKGKPLAIKEELKPSIDRGIKDAFFYMHEITEKRHLENMYWEDRHWSFVMVPDEKNEFDFITENKVDIDNRAASWNFFTFYPTVLHKDRLGTAYLAPIQDSKGNALEAGANYKFTVQKDIPVKQFWSLTLYDYNTFSFIKNPQDKHGLSSFDDLQANEDGTIDIYIGSDAPEGLESNWLPTHGKKPYLWFRFYGPDKTFYSKEFKLNDLVKQ